MEVYRKFIVEAITAVLVLAALFIPRAGLVTVEEINGIATLILTIVTLGGPALVYLVPNAANWAKKFGRGPNYGAYRKAIVSGVMTLLTVVAMFFPSIGLVTEGHVSAVVGLVVVLISLFGTFFVWRVPNAPAS